MRAAFLAPLVALAVRRPRATLLGAALAVLVAAPGLLRLELRTDGHALVPPDDPAIAFDHQVREQFDLRDPIAVHVETDHPDGIYNSATLALVRDLTAALADLPEVGPAHVSSLATEKRDEVLPGTLEFRTILDPFPSTPTLLARVRDDVDAIGIVRGTLVSEDDRSTVVVVGVPSAEPGRTEEAAALRTRLYRQVRAIAEAVEAAASGAVAGESGAPGAGTAPRVEHRISVVGAPAAETLLGVHILEDLATSLPLALGIIALALYVAGGGPWAMILGLSEVGACLVLTFGIMGWMGVPVYLPTAVLPVILTTLGLADEIHVFWHVRRRLRRDRQGLASAGRSRASTRQTIEEAVGEMIGPVTLTSITTAAGFLSFCISPIPPVRWLGAFAALGIGICLLWTATVVPAALVSLGPGSWAGKEGRRPAGPCNAHRLAAGLTRQRTPILAAIAAITAVAVVGAARLEVQDGWVDGFAEDSPFRQATERVNGAYFGTHLLRIRLDLGAELADDVPEPARSGRLGPVGPLLSPAKLAAVDQLEALLRARPEVGGVLGPASHLRTVRYLWQARRVGERELPADAWAIQATVARFAEARGEHARRQVIDDSLRYGIVTVFLGNANYRQTAELVSAVREWQRGPGAAVGIEVGFAGDVAVSQTMIPAIVETQVGSVLLALVTALVVVGGLRRSFRYAWLATLPAIVAVCWIFGLMGWAAIPLGVATSMFCAITLGVGIDFGIHFMARLERARSERARSERARRDRDLATGSESAAVRPVARALAEAGPAIAVDALAMGAGFGILVFSQVPANGRLGLLVAVALYSSAILTLVGLAALVTGARRPGAR